MTLSSVTTRFSVTTDFSATTRCRMDNRGSNNSRIPAANSQFYHPATTVDSMQNANARPVSVSTYVTSGEPRVSTLGFSYYSGDDEDFSERAGFNSLSMMIPAGLSTETTFAFESFENAVLPMICGGVGDLFTTNAAV